MSMQATDWIESWAKKFRAALRQTDGRNNALERLESKGCDPDAIIGCSELNDAKSASIC